MELNQTMSPTEAREAERRAREVNARLRRSDGTQRGELGRQAFLRLLVTELRHQDPTNPMADKEFISQMAQFSSLEQMQNMNESIQNLHNSSRATEAFALLGKRVDAVVSSSGETVSGVVSRVSYRNNEVRLIVNNRELQLSEINAVYPAEAPRETPAPVARPRTAAPSTVTAPAAATTVQSRQ